MTATFYVGDAIDVMGKLPEKSVDLILTSPPFLALRSYLPSDHPDKALEGGSQATPGEFIDWMIDVVEACDRVLAPHGSLCIELGDTYAGSGGAGGDYDPGGWREGQEKFRQNKYERIAADGFVDPDGREIPRGIRNLHGKKQGGGTGWPLAKSLSLIPELFRLTLVYGTNPLTGRTTDRWRLRNVVRWVRPNPPVGAPGDKFRPATSELMVFCKSAKRYFDLDAVREPYSREQIRAPLHTFKDAGNLDNNKGRVKGGLGEFRSIDSAGAPPLDWWQIPEASMLRRPCEHGRYDPHFIRNSSDLDCPGGEFLLPQSAQAPPLDWWNIPLLEGEEPTKGGPKAKGYDPEERRQRAVQQTTNHGGSKEARQDFGEAFYNAGNPLGAPPLDWWNIPPGGYEGAHYAVFPPELCIKPIKAMCPEKVCRVCGEPSRRLVEVDYSEGAVRGFTSDNGSGRGGHQGIPNATRLVTSQAWSDCGHDDWRPGLVLDPFGGSGTTALVATGHGRDCILIDLDERNYELALQRVGPFILSRADTV